VLTLFFGSLPAIKILERRGREDVFNPENHSLGHLFSLWKRSFGSESLRLEEESPQREGFF